MPWDTWAESELPIDHPICSIGDKGIGYKGIDKKGGLVRITPPDAPQVPLPLGTDPGAHWGVWGAKPGPNGVLSGPGTPTDPRSHLFAPKRVAIPPFVTSGLGF